MIICWNGLVSVLLWNVVLSKQVCSCVLPFKPMTLRFTLTAVTMVTSRKQRPERQRAFLECFFFFLHGKDIVWRVLHGDGMKGESER